MTCGFWNTCGWNKDEQSDHSKIREMCIQGIDIIGIAETKLRGNDKLIIDGYEWIGHNRVNIHKRAKIGSGGVGFLVKKCLYNIFNIDVLDKSYEGILWIKCSSKFCDAVISMCVCYLPPDGSTRNSDAEDFFDTSALL